MTGSQRGDGAVFALDITERTIYAGTRRGEVQMFDLRGSRSLTTRDGGGGLPGKEERETKAEVSGGRLFAFRTPPGSLWITL